MFHLTCFISWRGQTVAMPNLKGTLMTQDGRRFAHQHHAEARAVRKALAQGFKMSECSVLVVRDRYNGQVGMAKPCKRCMKLLIDLGIPAKRIRWTVNA